MEAIDPLTLVQPRSVGISGAATATNAAASRGSAEFINTEEANRAQAGAISADSAESIRRGGRDAAIVKEEDRARENALVEITKSIVGITGGVATDPNSQMAQLLVQKEQGHIEARSQLQAIHDAQGMSIMDDPIGWLSQAFTMPDQIAKYNSTVDLVGETQAHIDGLVENQKVQTLRAQSVVPAASTAKILAEKDQLIAQANVAADAVELSAVVNDTNMAHMKLSALQGDASRALQMSNAENAVVIQNASLEEREIRLREFLENDELKKQDAAYNNKMIQLASVRIGREITPAEWRSMPADIKKAVYLTLTGAPDPVTAVQAAATVGAKIQPSQQAFVETVNTEYMTAAANAAKTPAWVTAKDEDAKNRLIGAEVRKQLERKLMNASANSVLAPMSPSAMIAQNLFNPAVAKALEPLAKDTTFNPENVATALGVYYKGDLSKTAEALAYVTSVSQEARLTAMDARGRYGVGMVNAKGDPVNSYSIDAPGAFTGRQDIATKKGALIYLQGMLSPTAGYAKTFRKLGSELLDKTPGFVMDTGSVLPGVGAVVNASKVASTLKGE